MKQETVTPAPFRPGSHFRIMDETSHDPYQKLENLSESAVCSNCHAVYWEGRWQWITTAPGALLTRCPACKRIHQKIPAGFVTIQGAFAHDHRDEMLSLVHHLETSEKSEHPLRRIMWIEYQEEGVKITTTDIHLARSIGEALQRAYKGVLDYDFNDSEYQLRVLWKR